MVTDDADVSIMFTGWWLFLFGELKKNFSKFLLCTGIWCLLL